VDLYRVFRPSWEIWSARLEKARFVPPNAFLPRCLRLETPACLPPWTLIWPNLIPWITFRPVFQSHCVFVCLRGRNLKCLNPCFRESLCPIPHELSKIHQNQGFTLHVGKGLGSVLGLWAGSSGATVLSSQILSAQFCISRQGLTSLYGQIDLNLTLKPSQTPDQMWSESALNWPKRGVLGHFFTPPVRGNKPSWLFHVAWASQNLVRISVLLGLGLIHRILNIQSLFGLKIGSTGHTSRGL
jgi:hypothetical protein